MQNRKEAKGILVLVDTHASSPFPTWPSFGAVVGFGVGSSWRLAWPNLDGREEEGEAELGSEAPLPRIGMGGRGRRPRAGRLLATLQSGQGCAADRCPERQQEASGKISVKRCQAKAVFNGLIELRTARNSC